MAIVAGTPITFPVKRGYGVNAHGSLDMWVKRTCDELFAHDPTIVKIDETRWNTHTHAVAQLVPKRRVPDKPA